MTQISSGGVVGAGQKSRGVPAKAISCFFAFVVLVIAAPGFLAFTHSQLKAGAEAPVTVTADGQIPGLPATGSQPAATKVRVDAKGFMSTLWSELVPTWARYFCQGFALWFLVFLGYRAFDHGKPFTGFVLLFTVAYAVFLVGFSWFGLPMTTVTSGELGVNFQQSGDLTSVSMNPEMYRELLLKLDVLMSRLWNVIWFGWAVLIISLFIRGRKPGGPVA